MENKKQRTLQDIQMKVENSLIETGASNHSYDYLQQIATQLSQIYMKIQQSSQDYFEELSKLEEEMSKDISNYHLDNFTQIKNDLEKFNECFNMREELQEETMKNLNNITNLNNQLLGSKECWNQ